MAHFPLEGPTSYVLCQSMSVGVSICVEDSVDATTSPSMMSKVSSSPMFVATPLVVAPPLLTT